MNARVLVTGGGSGIGRATVEKLVSQGAQVVVCGRRAELLDDVARMHPGHVKTLVCDLADADARASLVEKSAELMGGITGLVHSAGAVFHEPPGHISEAHLRAQLELNLVAPLRLGEDALRVMPEGGSMVFVSSTLAVRPVVTSAVYSASKAGLLQVMRVLALAGAPRRIRVNAVVPGVVDTEMVRVARPPLDVEATLEQLRSLHPLGRLGEPEDVAESIVHLLSSDWITGTELVVDGGLLLHG